MSSKMRDFFTFYFQWMELLVIRVFNVTVSYHLSWIDF